MYVEEVLSLLMFLALALLLFSGYPVAFVLPGVALGFGTLGMMLGTFSARGPSSVSVPPALA